MHKSGAVAVVPKVGLPTSGGVSPGDITPESIGAAPADHRHDNATQSVDGFMPAADKLKLDTILEAIQDAVADQLSAGNSTAHIGITFAYSDSTGKISATVNFPTTVAAHKNTHITGGTDVIPDATTTDSGLFSAAEKTKLAALNTKTSHKKNIAVAVTGGTNVTTDVVFASLTIPGNILAVEDAIEIEAYGTTNNGTTATTCTWWVRIGGTKMTLMAQAMGTTATTGASWGLNGLITVRTIGVSGTLAANAFSMWKTVATPQGAAQSTAKDTTAPLLIELGATMSVANANNSITAQIARIALAP